MKSNQILMKGPLVLATLAGTKTETRRPIDRLLKYGKIFELDRLSSGNFSFKYRRGKAYCHDFLTLQQMLDACPYGRVADELWIRETWAGRDNGDGTYSDVRYKADYLDGSKPLDRWMPSIHMPRSVCRQRLEIVSVDISRVRDITDEQACREGVVHNPKMPLNSLVSNIVNFQSNTALGELLCVDPELYTIGNDSDGKTERERVTGTTPRGCFAYVWETCYPGSWGLNELVWVIKYKRKTQ